MYKLIGIKDVSFTTQDGKVISGRSLFFVFDDPRTTGKACDKIFLSDSKFAGLKIGVGDEFQIFYNKYGKPDYIQIVSK